MAFSLSSGGASNVKEAAACELIGTKKGAIFSLIYLFKSFCIYSIPHNYVIPQAMLHAIPQTHSSFYPHRFFEVMWKRNTEFKSVFQSQAKTKNGIEKRLALRYTHSISSWKKRAFFKALVTKRNRSHSWHVKVLDFAPFRGSCVRGFELSHRNQVNSITKITHTHNLHVKVLDVARFKICTWKNAYCLRDYFPQRMF